MRLFFLLFFFCLPSIAAENNISYIFDNIKLNELTKITYSDIVNSGFIADDDFNKDDRTVTIHLKDKSKEQVRAAVKRLIEAYGYEMDIQGNVPYIARKKEKQIEEIERHAFYYQPKYRPTAYITDLVSNIFESGRFTYQRPVKTASQETSGQSVQDTGTSAYSMQARNYDAFIFYGTAAEIEQLQALINQIDRPTGEILVKAFIYEVSNGKGDSTAFSSALNLLGSRLNINMAANALANTISLNTGGIEAVFSALSTDNRFKVVSAPSLRVKDREKARFLVGSEVPVLGNVTYQQNGVPVQW